MGDRLYHCWNDMKRRCAKGPTYIAKGITVCAEWQSFETFRKWAKKNGYRAKLTLDRIDNNVGYTPTNCRWATPEVQSNNREVVKIVEFRGESHTLWEWSKLVNIPARTLYMRLRKGWDLERAFTQPARVQKTVKKPRKRAPIAHTSIRSR